MALNIYTPEKQKIIHRTSADFKRRFVTVPIHLAQNDNGLSVIAVSLYEDNIPYQIPESDGSHGITIQMKILHGGRDSGYFSFKGVSEDHSVAYFETTEYGTKVSGNLIAYVMVTFGSERAYSSPINIFIDSKP